MDWCSAIASILERSKDRKGVCQHNIIGKLRVELKMDEDMFFQFIKPVLLIGYTPKWNFAIGSAEVGAEEGWHTVAFDDSAGDQINGGGNLAGAGLPKYQGAAWYRREISIPERQRKGTRFSPRIYKGCDRSFFFDISEKVKNGRTYHLTAKADKKVFAGGIAKLVLLYRGAPRRRVSAGSNDIYPQE